MRAVILAFLLATACATGASAQSPSAGVGSQLGEAPDGGAATSDAATDGAPEVSAQPGLEADLGAARAAAARGDVEGARAMLDGILGRQPAASLRLAASVLLARLELARGDASAARTTLAPLSGPAAPADVRLLMGMAELRLGHAAQARELLQPFVDVRDAPLGALGESQADAAQEVRGAYAEALTATGDAEGALRQWDAYLRAGREPERAFARQRATELAARVSADDAARLFAASQEPSLARAALGARAALRARAKGDVGAATAIEQQTAQARGGLGFEDPVERTGPGDPNRLGLAVPFTGRFQPVGEAALRGAMTAGAVPSTMSTLQLCVRDAGSDPERAVSAIAELARREAVLGIVGTTERKASAAAQGEAARLGVPLMVLDDQVPGAVSTSFQLIHSPERRAVELARHALRLGVRSFAVLGPDSALGKRLADAFRAEVLAGGGRITAEVTYVTGVTSFGKPVATIKSSQPQAVFIPDTAQRLELIAPALAFADLWPQPWVPSSTGKAPKAAPKGGARTRSILLLSTAHDLSERLISAAGRYVQGALLAPGFFADPADARSAAFVTEYRAAFGQDPHATEAYAHDALTVLRTAVGRGAQTRTELMQRLAREAFPALTGDIRFGPDHARVDAPTVYEVSGSEIHPRK